MNPAIRVIKLKPAVRFDGQRYKRLFLHEPTVADVLAADTHFNGGVTMCNVRHRQVQLVAASADVPVGVVELMPVHLFAKAWAHVSSFIEPPADAA